METIANLLETPRNPGKENIPQLFLFMFIPAVGICPKGQLLMFCIPRDVSTLTSCVRGKSRIKKLCRQHDAFAILSATSTRTAIGLKKTRKR